MYSRTVNTFSNLDVVSEPQANAAPGGVGQRHIFVEQAVDLSRVIIGRCGDTTDVAYFETLLEGGSYIGPSGARVACRVVAPSRNSPVVHEVDAA
jgi:predicted metal-dependent phosphotriesterase family hydrolase